MPNLLIPQDNLLRHINDLVDFSFIQQELMDKYCLDNGRMAQSPVRMFKYLLLKTIYASSRNKTTIPEGEFLTLCTRKGKREENNRSDDAIYRKKSINFAEKFQDCALNIKERIEELLEDIGDGVYGKDTEIRLALLAAVAGESILLLGPPGIAKSMIARKIKSAFKGAKAFEYLMSRFSTPDEVFGPVSIARLKENDAYERNTTGYLPDADVVFLDEIWKAGPAIQNTLLTVINEKLFRNGDKEIRLPLKLLIAASNELPAKGEGLEALWDRFLIRIISGCIDDEQLFYQMLLTADDYKPRSVRNPITTKELTEWQAAIKQVEVPQEILASITQIRAALRRIEIPQSEMVRQVYVSDRRWKKIVQLLRASAFVHGRTAVDATDLIVAHHCLWNNPDERDAVRQIVLSSLLHPLRMTLDNIKKSLSNDLRRRQMARAMEQMQMSRYDQELRLFDSFYFHVEKHGTGHTFIFAPDFLSLSRDMRNPTKGIIYQELDKRRSIIRCIEQAGMSSPQGNIEAEQVKLYRDELHLYINGVQMNLERNFDGRLMPEVAAVEESAHDYYNDIERLVADTAALQASLGGNIFFTPSDVKALDMAFADLCKEISYTRIDIAKLDD